MPRLDSFSPMQTRGTFDLLLVSAVLAATGTPATAQDQPLVLEPSGSWVVDYAEESCALQRNFGTRDVAGTLELRQFAPGNAFQLTFITADLGEPGNSATVTYHPDTEAFEPADSLFGNYGGGVWSVVFSDTLRTSAIKREATDLSSQGERESRDALLVWTDEDRNARESQINAISIMRAFDRSVTLNSGSLHAPMEVMRTCLDELLTHWGLDANAHKALTQRASPAEGFTVNYPRDMVRREQNGIVYVRLNISAGGEVTNCNMQLPVPHDSFRDRVCSDFRDVRFDPALDADGQPIDSYWVESIFFNLT